MAVTLRVMEYDKQAHLLEDYTRHVEPPTFELYPHPEAFRIVVMPETGWNDAYQLLRHTFVLERTDDGKFGCGLTEQAGDKSGEAGS